MGDLYVIELASNTKWLEKKMARIDGSLVFERT